MRYLTNAGVFLVFQLGASKMYWEKSRNHNTLRYMMIGMGQGINDM